MLRFRPLVLAFWLAVRRPRGARLRGLAGLTLERLQRPGTDSEAARTILQDHFGARSDGELPVVFRTARPRARHAGAARRAGRGAAAVPDGPSATLLRAAGDVVYGDDRTGPHLRRRRATRSHLRALRPPAGVRAYVTGQAAIQHDLDPIFSSGPGLARRSRSRSRSHVLLLVLGLSAAVPCRSSSPRARSRARSPSSGAVAHAGRRRATSSNLVELIGLGLAVDYSLLVVYRFREELAPRATTSTRRSCATMATAGRAVVFSGLTVAIGLALLLACPCRSSARSGPARLFVPLVSVAAATTLQPALLSLLRPPWRTPAVARSCRRRLVRCRGGHRLLGTGSPGRSCAARSSSSRSARRSSLGVAAPVAGLRLTPGSISVLPPGSESVTGLRAAPERRRRGRPHPHRDRRRLRPPGGVRTPAVRAAISRLADAVFHDREAYVTANGRKAPYVDPSGRYARVFVVGRHEYGEPAAAALVARLRDTLSPARASRPACASRGRCAAAGRRLPRPRLRTAPLAPRRSARAHVPRPARRVPLAAAAAEGGGS